MTAPSAPLDQFSDNLVPMLTHALQQVNLHNVLASLKDSRGRPLDTQSFKKQHNSKTHRIKKNNFSNPNVIIWKK